jgi:ABC-type amino acid transport substrate-binding protein
MPDQSTAKPLVVASAYPDPPFDVLENGTLTGFDIELMRAIGAILARSIEPVRYAGDDFNGIFAGLQNGSYDAVISGTTITPERRQSALFSDPYLEFGQGVAVTAARAEFTHGSNDLRGATVGIQRGNTSQAVANELLAGGIIASIQYYPYDAIETALDDLQAGKIDAVIKLAPVLQHLLANRPSLHLAFEVPTHERLAIAVAKDDVDLCQGINGALRALQTDGTLAALRKRWSC